MNNSFLGGATESVEKTEERLQIIDDHLRQMDEVSDSSTDSEDECRPISINTHHITQKQLHFVMVIKPHLLIR